TVLISGGNVSAVSEVYDSATNRFHTVGSMTTGRESHSATLLGNGLVLIAGGATRAADGTYVFLSSAELYDPGTATYRATGNMLDVHSEHQAIQLGNGNALIVGGTN